MKKLPGLFATIIAASLVFGTMYVLTQQVLRLDANDPQIQLAEDTADSFNHGGNPSIIGASPKTDVANSLSPFLIIYDNNRQLVASSAVLDGNNPVLPPGVLSHVSSGHQNRLTWQPRGGVRLAAVVVKYNGGYVLAGRSLREVERRESSALDLVMVGWITTIVVILAGSWLSLPRKARG